MIERAANRADADDRGRLDALDRGHEISRGRVLVSVRLLKVEQVGAGGLEQTVDVEHVDAGLRAVRPTKCFLLRNLGTHRICENAEAEQQQKKLRKLLQARALDVVDAHYSDTTACLAGATLRP